MGLQNTNENVYHGFGNLVIWLWKSFGIIVKGVRMKPANPNVVSTFSDTVSFHIDLAV